jgi:hypothetical protein
VNEFARSDVKIIYSRKNAPFDHRADLKKMLADLEAKMPKPAAAASHLGDKK